MQNQTNVPVSGYHELLAANGLTQNVKHFDDLFTQIAVSDNGYLAIYYPYLPAFKKSGPFDGAPEQPEQLIILHTSQIIDFEIDLEGVENTKVSSGLGGAIVGGLLGGATGAVIGSAATSGKVKNTSAITGAVMVIHTKSFENPRVEVRLYSAFGLYSPFGGGTGAATYPFKLRQYCMDKKGRINATGLISKEGKELAKSVFNNGAINMPRIEELQSTLTQMLAAQQQSEMAAIKAPQLSSADELAKFKSLLDSGTISQEEFDAKKKQLLGL